MLTKEKGKWKDEITRVVPNNQTIDNMQEDYI